MSVNHSPVTFTVPPQCAHGSLVIDHNPPNSVEKWSTGDIAWIVFVLCLGMAARLFRIDSQPFWLDEAFTFQRIHLGLTGLIADSFSNRHMPSYFLMLQGLSQFDSSHAMLRLPSALFGALSAGTVFAIGRRIGGRTSAIVAGLLMALAPLQVQYGQEARSYTLVTLLITIALWGLVRLAQNPWRASLDLRSPHFDRRGWTAYVLGTIGALDVLGAAAPWLIVSNVSLFLIWRRLRQQPSPEPRTRFRRHWLLSLVVILVCCLPFYGAILAASDGQMLQKFDWIPQLNWHDLWVAASSVYLMRMAAVVRFDLLHTAVPVLGALVALLAGMGVWRARERLEGRIVLLGFVVLPLLVLAVSLFKPMLMPRYILWSAAPFFLLVGLGAAHLPRRILPGVISALALLCAINLVPVYQRETKPRWDMAAATLAANVRPGDTVFTADPNGATMLAVLQPKHATPIERTALVTDRFDLALARWKQGGRVWAVNGRSALGQGVDLAAFENSTAALGTPTLQIAEGREITILMFPASAGQN